MGTKALVFKDKRTGLRGTKYSPWADYTEFATGRVFGFYTPWRIIRRNRSHTLMFKMGCQEAVLSTLTRSSVVEQYSRYRHLTRAPGNSAMGYKTCGELGWVAQAEIRSIIRAVNKARKLAKYPLIQNYPA